MRPDLPLQPWVRICVSWRWDKAPEGRGLSPGSSMALCCPLLTHSVTVGPALLLCLAWTSWTLQSSGQVVPGANIRLTC